MSFAELRAANMRRSKEWQVDEAFDAMFYAVATGGECGEALNVMKKLRRDQIDAIGVWSCPSSASLEDLAQEMSDTIIYMDLAQSLGIDLWPAIIKTFNAKSDDMGFTTKLA